MTDTISQQLNEVFQKAALSYARKVLTSWDDLKELSEITDRAAERRDELIARFDEEYDARFDAVRQRLYDEAVQPHLNHPAPSGAPVSGNDTIIWQAHEEVRRTHEADLQAIDDQAVRDAEDLIDRARRLNDMQGVSRGEFARTSERRSGFDRRIPTQSQD